MADTDQHVAKMKLQVMVRLRPVESEQTSNSSNGLVNLQSRIINLHDPVKEHASQFVFDNAFGSDAQQSDVFEHAGKPLVEHVVAGYNAAALAYG